MRKLKDKVKKKHRRPNLPRAASQALAPRSPSQMQKSKRTEAEALTLISEKLHPDLLCDLAYMRLSRCMGMTGDNLEAAVPAAFNFQQDMRPKDGLERLALSQALLAEGRATWLTKLATTLKDAKSLGIVLEACERATGTYMRLMGAIREYRQPSSQSTTVSIANVAHQQQIVQQVGNFEGRKNDEQTRIENGGIIDAEVVSSVAERTEVTEEINPQKAAVDTKLRAEKLTRKTPKRDERTQTRRAVRRHRRIPKAGEGHDQAADDCSEDW